MAGRLRAWSSLAGVASVVLMVVGAILLFDGPSNSSPAKMAAWYGSSSNRTKLNIGWILTGLALFCFVWFVGALREQISAGERARPEDGTLLSTIATVGGAAFAAVALCVIGLADGLKTMSDDTYHHQVYSGLLHGASDAAYMMLVSGGAAMAALIFATSAAILAFGFLPRWLGWFGYVAGAAALLSILFFTMLLWLLWLACVSVVLFMRARSSAAVAESRRVLPA